jgi:hypothetical protein
MPIEDVAEVRVDGKLLARAWDKGAAVGQAQPTEYANQLIEAGLAEAPRLTTGTWLHFVMMSGERRPALVSHVVVEEALIVNLWVFADGKNDGEEWVAGPVWFPEVYHGYGHLSPGTWLWPDQVGTAPE